MQSIRNPLLEQVLDLPDISIESYTLIENVLCLKLNLLNHQISCPHCQQSSHEINQIKPILVRDLPAFGKIVYLKIPRRQFYCKRCKKYPTEPLEFLGKRRTYTLRYEQYVYRKVLHSSVAQVSREEALTEEIVQGIFNTVRTRIKNNSGLNASRS